MLRLDVTTPPGGGGVEGQCKELGRLGFHDSRNLSSVKAVEHARLMLEFAAVPRTQRHRAYFARMATKFLAPLSASADDDARSAAIRRQWHARQLAVRA